MSFIFSAQLYTALLTLPFYNSNNNIKLLINMTPSITINESYTNNLNAYGFLSISDLTFDFENDITCIVMGNTQTNNAISDYIYNIALNPELINDVIIDGINEGRISGFYISYLENDGWLNIFLKEINISVSPSYSIAPSETENVGVECIYDLSFYFSLQIGNWFDVVSYTINEVGTFEIDTLTNFETYGAINVNTIYTALYYNNDFDDVDYLYNTTEDLYNTGYENGYQDGEQDGYENGYQDGEQDGYEDGEQDGYNKKYDFLQIISGAFDAVSNFFNMEIFPGVKFIYIIGIPIVIAVLRFVIGWFR